MNKGVAGIGVMRVGCRWFSSAKLPWVWLSVAYDALSSWLVGRRQMPYLTLSGRRRRRLRTPISSVEASLICPFLLQTDGSFFRLAVVWSVPWSGGLRGEMC